MGDASKYRLFAAVVDHLLAAVVGLLLASRLAGGRDGLPWILASVGYLSYFLIQEALWRKTLGKSLFGLTVVRLDGEAVGWREAVLRTALRAVEVNPILLGGLPAAIAIVSSERRQRLGDMLASTVVQRNRTDD